MHRKSFIKLALLVLVLFLPLSLFASDNGAENLGITNENIGLESDSSQNYSEKQNAEEQNSEDYDEINATDIYNEAREDESLPPFSISDFETLSTSSIFDKLFTSVFESPNSRVAFYQNAIEDVVINRSHILPPLHHIGYREATIGFKVVGHCIPLALVPFASFNITDHFTIEAGLGAGYRDLTTRNSDKTKRDYYSLWFAEGVIGASYRNIVPGLDLGFMFTALFQGIDVVIQGDPRSNPYQVPLFDGVFSLNLQYTNATKRDLMLSGFNTNFEFSYYLKNYYTLSALVSYGTKPFAEVFNASGKHMFAMNFTTAAYFGNYGSFTGTQNIADFWRTKFDFGLRATTQSEWDKPFTFKWSNVLLFSGPEYYKLRPYARLFFEFGTTWGTHYYDSTNTAAEWAFNFGAEFGISILDFVGLYIRLSAPYPYYSIDGPKDSWKWSFRFEIDLESV